MYLLISFIAFNIVSDLLISQIIQNTDLDIFLNLVINYKVFFITAAYFFVYSVSYFIYLDIKKKNLEIELNPIFLIIIYHFIGLLLLSILIIYFNISLMINIIFMFLLFYSLLNQLVKISDFSYFKLFMLFMIYFIIIGILYTLMLCSLLIFFEFSGFIFYLVKDCFNNYY